MRKVIRRFFYRRIKRAFVSAVFVSAVFVFAVGICSLVFGGMYGFGSMPTAWKLRETVEVQTRDDEALPSQKEKESLLPFLNHFKNPCWYEEDTDLRFMIKTRRLRCLPYFFLAGFPKCATTDLMNKIIQHPDIVEADHKEMHWWTHRRYNVWNEENCIPFDWYLSNFQKISDILQTSCPGEETSKDNSSSPCGRLISGDGSPSTIWQSENLMKNLQKVLSESQFEALWNRVSENRMDMSLPKYDKSEILEKIKHFTEVPIAVPDMIRSLLPDARIIAILREPVERLYSDYNYFNNKNTSPLDFDRLVTKSIKEINDCLAHRKERICAFTKYSNFYVIRPYGGLYSIYIKDWLAVFPRDQLLFLRTEDYKANPRATLEKIFDHLGLEPLDKEAMQLITAHSHQLNTNEKEIPPMYNRTREKLRDFYRKFNRQLADLLGDDAFTWQEFYQ